MSMSRNVLAMMDAAEMTGTSASPSTMDFWRGDDGQHAARCRNSGSGIVWLPSMSNPLGRTFNTLAAWHMALSVACKILMRSISGGQTTPSPQASATAPISAARPSRRVGDNTLESARPGITAPSGQNHRRRNHGTGKAARRLHRSRQPPKRVCRGTSRPASRKGTEAALPARIRIFCGQPYTLRNKRPKREKGIFAGKIPFSQNARRPGGKRLTAGKNSPLP